MAQDDIGQEDRTEEATPERREEYRERGQVVVSRELTSVLVLAASIVFLSLYTPTYSRTLQRLFVSEFEQLGTRRITHANFMSYAGDMWSQMLLLIVPIFVVTLAIAAAATLLQTRFNWSWQRLKPDFSRLSLAQGLVRMVNLQALVELLKSTAKMVAVALVAWLILFGEWSRVPELMAYPLASTWSYWGGITKSLFWSVAGLLLFVAGGDYLYNFISFERRLKMTKQEVKEDFKRREVDPHLKGRMRSMQRKIVMQGTLAKTRKATALITNPTHYSIAIKYELGDAAPSLVAKGVDELALLMREIARDEKIPIIENRPLARALYAQVKEGEEIPSKFYRAVAEIIRYVFKLKGKALPQPSRRARVAADTGAGANPPS